MAGTKFAISNKLALVISGAILFALLVNIEPTQAEQIQLSSILPKLEAIHEDAKSLLIKNVELKNKILNALQAQNEAKIKQVKAIKMADSNNGTNASPLRQIKAQTMAPPDPQLHHNSQQFFQSNGMPDFAPQNGTEIDYSELEEFNKWAETNLEYAVKNTQASAEALKEEAQHNDGKVDYSEQAIKDGIEGVKYWQSAVIFQDKTLKNEKYESSD